MISKTKFMARTLHGLVVVRRNGTEEQKGQADKIIADIKKLKNRFEIGEINVVTYKQKLRHQLHLLHTLADAIKVAKDEEKAQAKVEKAEAKAEKKASKENEPVDVEVIGEPVTVS
jgi:hypothetical protein